MEFRLPALGEGIESATVTAVFVKPGDAVKTGQTVLSVETDKAAMDVEADEDGIVGELLVKPGDKLPIGGLVFKSSGTGKSEPARPAPAPKPETKVSSSETIRHEPAMPKAAASANGQDSGQKREFHLPPLGEGIDVATVTAVLIKAGDAVKVGQGVLSVETDKAAMDVETDVEGTVDQILVQPGGKLNIGSPVFSLKVSSSIGNSAPIAETPRTQAKPVESAVATSAAPSAAIARNSHHQESSLPHPLVSQATTGNGTASRVLIPAGPATRRLARELGVGLGEVKGSGRGGRVTLDDIKSFVRDERKKTKETGSAISGSIVNVFTLPALPDFTKFGPVEVKEFASLRQTIAKNLTIGWRTMPMVTQHDLADITDLEAGRKRIVDALPKGSPKITMTILAIKACIAALKEFPNFNSSYDMNAGKLIVKKYYHIGIAVDTERGLVVPVIKDADKKTIRDLSAEVVTLAEKARAGKLAIDEMRGGTFTITNLGGIGGTGFTPIVNYPEVAILGLSRSSLQPVVRDGQIVARLMMPLSLTYDHRVIDGADGCRFTVRLAQLFSDPLRLLMET